MTRVPDGTVLDMPGLGADVVVYVGPYIAALNCYRLGIMEGAGVRGGPCAAHLVEQAYDRCLPERLAELKRKHGSRR